MQLFNTETGFSMLLSDRVVFVLMIALLELTQSKMPFFSEKN